MSSFVWRHPNPLSLGRDFGLVLRSLRYKISVVTYARQAQERVFGPLKVFALAMVYDPNRALGRLLVNYSCSTPFIYVPVSLSTKRNDVCVMDFWNCQVRDVVSVAFELMRCDILEFLRRTLRPLQRLMILQQPGESVICKFLSTLGFSRCLCRSMLHVFGFHSSVLVGAN